MIVSRTHIRVRYADTDQMRMVYHSKFLEYFEQGRSDLLRDIGMPYPEIERRGFYLPVVEAHVEYKKAGRYDDLLLVKTILKEMPQARIRIEYEVENTSSGELLVAGYTIHGFLSAVNGKPTRAPQEFLFLVGKAFSQAG